MKVLVLAPHADDECIGVGGTIARHVAEGDDVTVAVMTGHGGGRHPIWGPEVWEIVRTECREAINLLGVRALLFEELPAVLLPDLPRWKVNAAVDSIVSRVCPEVLYVPFAFDLHRDHRVVFNAASVAWRPSTTHGQAVRAIYCYETQSETHWNAPYLEPGFAPNHYVDISDYLEPKLMALRCYKSQMRAFPDARSIEAMRALAMWRGSQVGLSAAEAFVVVRTLR